MGVWIETESLVQVAKDKQSHPAWVCGLKLFVDMFYRSTTESHPAWVCGLKPTLKGKDFKIVLSHPAWVCGLKHCPIRRQTLKIEVTPCVGVWIETDLHCNHDLL